MNVEISKAPGDGRPRQPKACGDLFDRQPLLDVQISKLGFADCRPLRLRAFGMEPR